MSWEVLQARYENETDSLIDRMYAERPIECAWCDCKVFENNSVQSDIFSSLNFCTTYCKQMFEEKWDKEDF